MSLLNLNVALLAYQDGPASQNPQMRLADIKWSMMGIPTDRFRNMPISLAPGETMTVASTARSITLSSATFIISSPIPGTMRIETSIGQRTSRDSGDATTVWDITKNGEVTRATASAGTAPDLSAVTVGDFINISSGFAPHNQGESIILSKGADYVEYVNSYAQTESGISNSPLSIYSNGPVQVGDILDITLSSFAFPNQGAFTITSVTDKYIEVSNPNTFPQTVSGVSSGVAVYPYAYKWMAVAVDRRVIIGLNGQAPSGLEVEPPIEGDIVKNPGIFIKRGKVFQVQVMNVGLKTVQGFLILSE